MEPVSVVIPARNEPPVSEEFLKELKETPCSWAVLTARRVLKELPTAEVILVDDASEGQYESCCEGVPSEVIVVRNEKNLGVGASRNRGIRGVATNNLLMICDAHVFPQEPGAYVNLVQHAADAEIFAVAQAVTLYHRSRKNGADFLFMRDKYIGWQYGPKRREDSYPIPVPNGGCYAFRRGVYDKLGLWPTTAGTFGHNPVTKGLMCYFTDTPAIMFKDAPVVHRYGGVGYTFDVLSQWKNACRVYAIVFEEETYKKYWFPILSQVLDSQYVAMMWDDVDVRQERLLFQTKKQHTDTEFFRECLGVPTIKGQEHAATVVTKVPQVAVVIPAWNEGDELKKTIKSLRTHSKFDHHIVVVDDASDCEYKIKPEDLPIIYHGNELAKYQAENPSEKSKGKAVAGNRKSAFMLRNGVRRGIPVCRNKGMKFAKEAFGLKPHDVLMLSDSHVRFDPDAVRFLTESAILTGGIVMPSFANWTDDPAEAVKKVYGAALTLRETRGIGARYLRTKPNISVSEVEHIIGSVYAATVETWEKVGKFYEIGLWGCAEAMLNIRAFFQGVKLYVDQRAFIRHKLIKGRTTPTPNYVIRVRLLHQLCFSWDIYERIFLPVISGLGDDSGFPGHLSDFIYEARDDLRRNALPGLSEKDFFKARLPELMDQLGVDAAIPLNDLVIGKLKKEEKEMDTEKKDGVMDISGATQEEMAKAVHTLVEPPMRWYQFACCRPPSSVAMLGWEKDGRKANVLMLSAVIPGKVPDTIETRVIAISGIARCPFCTEYNSLEETPEIKNFLLDEPFRVQQKAIEERLQ